MEVMLDEGSPPLAHPPALLDIGYISVLVQGDRDRSREYESHRILNLLC